MTEPENEVQGGHLLADGFRDTDSGNSLRLIRVCGDEIRYVHRWKKWLVYIDGKWVVDPANVLVTEKAKRVARVLFRIAVDPQLDSSHRDELINWAKKSESAAAIANMIKLAAGIPGVVVDHNHLDQRPEHLNVLNGTVNLRTGQLMPFNPEDLLIYQAPTIYDPTATCPLFLSCLERWQPDPTMRAYLQIFAGAAAATGYPIEEFHVHHGGGANGKGKFFGALMTVLGDYAVIPDKSLLVAQKHEPHPTVWAHLFRSRLAVGDETAEGARLNDEKVKYLTGGDRISGRRMHEDPWEYEPTHLLVVRTNHIPRIQAADEAMKRRYRLIPWDTTIPKEERDETLAVQLALEASGILNWIVAGAMAWLAHNRKVNIPALIADTTNSMFREVDPIGWFLTIATQKGGNLSVTTRELHEAYQVWRTDPRLDDNPKYVDVTELGSYIRDRGYRRNRVQVNGQHQAGWRGLGLIPAYVAEVARVKAEEPERLSDHGASGGTVTFRWTP